MINNKSKIFLFGSNCASVLNNLSLGFTENEVKVQAISFDFKRSPYNNYSNITCICKDNHPGKLKIYYYKLKGLLILIKWLLWSDVVHVYGNISNISYWLISVLGTNKFITFLGSDIRDPEIELVKNPYFKYAYNNPDYEYKNENHNRTSVLLGYLHKLNFKFIVWEVDIFIDEKFKKYTAIVAHSSVVNENVEEAATQKKLPVIVHSPTAPIAKGTPFVLEAIEKLKNKNIPFEFILLQNLSNDKYQKALAKADIYLDQFIWGAYGVAAQQAMQMGKVVVNYLTSHRIEMYGPDCPVQNATIDNLPEVLEKLILDVEGRQRIAAASIQYYQQQHKPSVVAKKMLAAYQKLAAK